MRLDDMVVLHLPWLERAAHWYCANPMDAEDLVSETVYKLLRYRDRFNPKHDFKPWARTIMHNIWVTNLGHDGKVRLDHECDTVCPADSLAMCRSIMSAVRDCARRSVCIECVILYAKGYSYGEIAARLGISAGTVKSRINTGRRIIREALKW